MARRRRYGREAEARATAAAASRLSLALYVGFSGALKKKVGCCQPLAAGERANSPRGRGMPAIEAQVRACRLETRQTIRLRR